MTLSGIAVRIVANHSFSDRSFAVGLLSLRSKRTKSTLARSLRLVLVALASSSCPKLAVRKVRVELLSSLVGSCSVAGNRRRQAWKVLSRLSWRATLTWLRAQRGIRRSLKKRFLGLFFSYSCLSFSCDCFNDCFVFLGERFRLLVLSRPRFCLAQLLLPEFHLRLFLVFYSFINFKTFWIWLDESFLMVFGVLVRLRQSFGQLFMLLGLFGFLFLIFLGAGRIISGLELGLWVCLCFGVTLTSEDRGSHFVLQLGGLGEWKAS